MPAGCEPNATYFVSKKAVRQSFGLASELLLGPELALLPLNHREFIAKSAGRKASGGAEAPTLTWLIRKVSGIGI